MGATSIVIIVLGGCSGASNPAASANMALLGPNSSATKTAQAILFNLDHGDANVTSPPTPCSSVASGSIGTVTAPYEECPVATPEGHFVTFTAKSDPDGGITFTDIGPRTFLDECYSHVRNDWFVWMKADQDNPEEPCPSGWLFHGGP